MERHVLVGHHRRYYKLVHKTRELIQSGVVGNLVAVNGQWNVRKHTEYFAPNWRRKWQAGPILTNLIHELDLLRYICGEIASLSAETSHQVMHAEKEDAAALVLRFDSGALGTFILSDQTPSPWGWETATGENAAFPRSAQNACKFMGTKACLDFPNLTLWRYPDSDGSWHDAMQPESIDIALGDAYIAQCAHFCAVIQGRETPRISAQDATNTLRATLAVFEAAKSGKRILL
jgi:predicted dehydrogenase